MKGYFTRFNSEGNLAHIEVEVMGTTPDITLYLHTNDVEFGLNDGNFYTGKTLPTIKFCAATIHFGARYMDVEEGRSSIVINGHVRKDSMNYFHDQITIYFN